MPPAFSGTAPVITADSHSDESPKRKSSAKRGWMIAIAASLVVALVTVLGIVGVRSFLGLDQLIALPTVSEPVPDRTYEATAPLLQVSTRSSFTFPADYDFDARTGEGYSYAWAFELFLDPALTSRADVFVYQDAAGQPLHISASEPTALLSTWGESVDVMKDQTSGSWGLEPEYYLVRHIDEQGEPLPTPIVTRITTEAPAMDSPTVNVAADPETGSMVMTWSPVEGAAEYIVVGSFAQVTDDSEGRLYKAYSVTPETEWSSVNDIDQVRSDSHQNAHLAQFSGQSADEMLGTGTEESDWRYETSAHRWGVIATDGVNYSRVATADAASVIPSLPYENAYYSMGARTLLYDRGDVEGLPVRFAFTSLDGRTRATQAVIHDDGIYPNDVGDLVFEIRGEGTKLVYTFEWLMPDEGFDAESFRQDFNARAAAAAPTTGGTDIISKSLAEVAIDATPVDTEAEVDFPVYGSDDFTRYVAGHVIAGNSIIDITRFANAPGAQTTYDALTEAMSQNPYAVGVGAYNTTESFGDERVVLHIEYALSENERHEIQQSISDSVAKVIAATITADMSDHDKAVALNRWITDNAVYDREAFAASEAGENLDSFMYAWRADGIFEHGTAVCGGYAMTYNALLNEAGVPTVYVTGDVLVAGRHAWNKVLIDGSWLAVDPTWNDSTAGNRWLLINDADFTAEATRTEDTEWIRDDLIGAYAAG